MVLFDSNVFIAGIVDDHAHHKPSLSLIQRVHRGDLEGAVCVHSLAESFSILTSYPGQPLPPSIAETMIQENILSHFHPVELGLEDYRKALARTKEKGLKSGAIYDALIYQAAVKKKMSLIYTWDTGDFTRLADPGIAIRAPG